MMENFTTGFALLHMSSAIRFLMMGDFAAYRGVTKATSVCQPHAVISQNPRIIVPPSSKQPFSLSDLLEMVVELRSTGTGVLLSFRVQSLVLKCNAFCPLAATHTTSMLGVGRGRMAATCPC